jgi:chromosome segregation ATPase
MWSEPMSVAEDFEEVGRGSWDEARLMLAIVSDPDRTRARLDELAAAVAAHDERLALAERSADEADAKHRRADDALAEVVDLQGRIEAANKSLRDRELAVARNEELHGAAVAKLADHEADLARRERILAAAIGSLRQYLADI